jgi:hypothetical protein
MLDSRHRRDASRDRRGGQFVFSFLEPATQGQYEGFHRNLERQKRLRDKIVPAGEVGFDTSGEAALQGNKHNGSVPVTRRLTDAKE